jgi:hypothetical protein
LKTLDRRAAAAFQQRRLNTAIDMADKAALWTRASQRIKEEAVEVGQKVVFVRDVKGAEVGKQGTVIGVSEDVVVVDCRLNEHLAPVVAHMWDVLPKRLWERILKHRSQQTPECRNQRQTPTLADGKRF